MPSPPLLTRTALFQIQKCIPRSWRELPPLTHHLLHQEQEEPPRNFSNDHPDPLIDSIRTLSAQGRLASAFSAYSHLRLQPAAPLLHPMSSLLACSTAVQAVPQGKQLHAHIISLGVLESPHLVSRLTSFYASLDLLKDAYAVAEGSTTRHAFPWNLLIAAYIRNGYWRDAILAYELMLERAVRVDKFTYPSVLKACGEMRELGLGREIHSRIEINGLGLDLFVGNALVAMYVKCGALDIARNLFDEMPERDVVSFNSMILGYASKGMWEETCGLLDLMPEGFQVNTVTWNTIIEGYLQMGNHREALRLISQQRTNGLAVDSVTLVIGLNACSLICSLRLGKEIHGLAVRMHCDGLEHVRNTLITMYSSCSRTSCAYVLFRKSASQSLVTWNAVIACFARANQVEEALWVFRDMVRSGIQPNFVTAVTVLSLCARFANIKHGQELHCFLTRHRFDGCLLLWNSLVDMYSKSGRISTAQRVFDIMSNHDVVSYTSLILGYGMKGEGFTSLKLFNEMIGRGYAPDHVTLVAVLSACSHSRLVTHGQIIFEKMVSLYGIIPRLEHYSCMVVLYGRAGLLRKAEELLDRMPLQPSAAMLATLVGACRIHGNREIGKRSADRLLDMRSDKLSHYILVANMYAYAGYWEELAGVRALMREMSIKKSSSCSWLDLGKEFYQCLVGDKSNSSVYEISMQFEGLAEHMRDDGYVGNEEFDYNEEVG